jgi:hypothetical protein
VVSNLLESGRAWRQKGDASSELAAWLDAQDIDLERGPPSEAAKTHASAGTGGDGSRHGGCADRRARCPEREQPGSRTVGVCDDGAWSPAAGCRAGRTCIPVHRGGARRPPRISTFSFSNGNIATFNAKLEFLSRYEFELYSVYLADKNCDARSVAATVLSQSSIWSRGYLGGLPYFYKNSEGCGHTTHPANYIFESSSPVQYVYIALFAGNNNGHSSVVNSLKHYNPYY